MTARPAAAHGWLGTLARLGLLAGVGFGLGLAGGVLYEEPALVTRFWLGETERVAWSRDPTPGAEAAGAVQPETAVAEAASGASRPEATRRAQAGDERPSVSAAAAPGSEAVQVGAFADSRAAQALAAQLRNKGFSVYVSPGSQGGEERWRVRVGPFPSRAEAESAAERLKSHERLPTWVLSEP